MHSTSDLPCVLCSEEADEDEFRKKLKDTQRIMQNNAS